MLLAMPKHVVKNLTIIDENSGYKQPLISHKDEDVWTLWEEKNCVFIYELSTAPPTKLATKCRF